MTTADLLDIAASICPDRDLIVFEGKRITYSQFLRRVNRLAGALREIGIGFGDRIGILEVNCPHYVETYFASARLGAIFVPLNFRAKEGEISYMVNHAECKALLVGERYLPLISAIRRELPTVQTFISLTKKEEGFLFYEDLWAKGTLSEDFPSVEDSDTTILMYTAGTTGRPKGVPLSHESFVSYILENVEPASLEIEERNLLSVPLYHVAGMQSLIASVYGGRTLILMRQFEAKEWLQIAQEERVNRAMLVPTMLKLLIDLPEFEQYDLSHLKVLTYGAAPMPFEVIRRAVELMPWVSFINAFGQTETASTITALGPEDHRIEGTEEEKAKKIKRLTSSIGKPLPDVEVKIVDPANRPLPPGEVGEIVARGRRVMRGYWRDPEKSALMITEDGWLKTGDRGWMDEEGYIYLTGRADDLIIRGGENISPEEVENVLYSHPKVEEAAVIGIPDPKWGQEVCAVVVLKPQMKATEEEIIAYCRDRLAGFKRPRSVIFVDALPRNALGKVLRKELREIYGRNHHNAK